MGRLFMLLLCSMAAAGMTLGLTREWMETGDREWSPLLELAAGYLCLHVPALILIHHFLHRHALTWSRAFGGPVFPFGTMMARVLGVTLLCLAVAYSLHQFSAVILQVLGREPVAQKAVLLLREGGALARWSIGILAVGLAPWVEEALFRGVLYPWFRERLGPGWSMGLTSVLFGGMHLNAAVFLSLTAFGWIMAWSYERWRNLWICILAHMAFNGVGFLVTLHA